MEVFENKGRPEDEGNSVPENEQAETSNHVALEVDQEDHLEMKIDENTASAIPAATPDDAPGTAEQDGGMTLEPDEATDEQRTDVIQAPEPATGSPTSTDGFKVQPAIADQPELEQGCQDVSVASPREGAREEEQEKDDILSNAVAIVKEEPEKPNDDIAPPLLEPCLETKRSKDSIAPKIEVDEQEDSPENQEVFPKKGADETHEAIEKDNEEEEDADEDTIPQETRFASQQDGESWDMELFNKPTEKPMVEWESGSNVWYQAHIMKESLTEVFVHFPPTRLTSARSEWIDRRSSRLWRGSLATSVWRYIKDREGAWEPRSGDTNSSGRGGTQGPSSSHSGGNSFRAKQRARSTSASRSRLTGRSRSRKRGGASSSSRGSREEPAEDTAASPDAGAKKARRRSAQDVESPPDAPHPASGRPPKLRRRTRFALDNAAVNGAEMATGSGSLSNSESSVRTPERDGDAGGRGRDRIVPGRTGRGLAASGGSFSEDDKGITGDEVEPNDPLLAWFQQHVQLLAAQGLEHSPSASALFAGRPKGRNQSTSKEARRKRVAQERTVQSPRYKRTKPETDAWSSRQGAGAQSTSTASSGRPGADSSHQSTKGGGATGSPRSQGRKGGGIHQSDADSKEPHTPLDTLSSRKSVKIRPSPPAAGQQPKPAPLVVLEEVDIFSATTPRAQRG